MYYRLLQQSPSIAEKVVNPPKQDVSVFADTQSNEIKDRIFDEFNSLSVVYQKVAQILFVQLLFHCSFLFENFSVNFQLHFIHNIVVKKLWI